MNRDITKRYSRIREETIKGKKVILHELLFHDDNIIEIKYFPDLRLLILYIQTYTWTPRKDNTKIFTAKKSEIVSLVVKLSTLLKSPLKINMGSIIDEDIFYVEFDETAKTFDIQLVESEIVGTWESYYIVKNYWKK